MNATTVLNRILDQVTDAFTPEVASRIIGLTVNVDVQLRIDELASKSNDGTLSAEEWAEYRSCIEAIDFVSILQAKAQRVLDATH